MPSADPVLAKFVRTNTMTVLAFVEVDRGGLALAVIVGQNGCL